MAFHSDGPSHRALSIMLSGLVTTLGVPLGLRLCFLPGQVHRSQYLWRRERQKSFVTESWELGLSAVPPPTDK